MKLLMLFPLLFATATLFAQDSLVVKVQLLDRKSNDVVQNVNVTIQNTTNNLTILTSNPKGLVAFNSPKNRQLKLSFSHPIYQSESKEISTNVKDDTLHTIVYLTAEKFSNIGEVIVKPVGVPYTIYGSQRLSVADFEVQLDGSYVLLAYPKRLTKGSELLVYDGQQVVNSFQVPGVAKELKRDFRGHTHIICNETVYGVKLADQVIQLSTIPKEYFSKYIMPIVDTNLSNVYFSTFNPIYPAFDYFKMDQLDSAYTKIVSIEDKVMMDLYLAEYKWVDVRVKLWAKQRERESGIAAEVWVGANYFTRSILYKELYAPMFHYNDTLVVFDYYLDRMMRYDKNGDFINSVAIFHHYQPKANGWKKDLIQDPITGRIYARFEKGGYTYLGLIDNQTGEINERIQLEYQWVDKVAVHDNEVYYVYRPLESIQKRYLYKEKLPYEFKSIRSL